MKIYKNSGFSSATVAYSIMTTNETTNDTETTESNATRQSQSERVSPSAEGLYQYSLFDRI